MRNYNESWCHTSAFCWLSVISWLSEMSVPRGFHSSKPREQEALDPLQRMSPCEWIATATAGAKHPKSPLKSSCRTLAGSQPLRFSWWGWGRVDSPAALGRVLDPAARACSSLCDSRADYPGSFEQISQPLCQFLHSESHHSLVDG